MHLRVVSYNIHRAIGLDRRFRPERIVEVLRHHDPDVVLLQEVDEGAPRSRELNLGKELAGALGFHHVVGHNVALRKGRYGNATLSRYPIVRERNIDLTVGLRKRRGCQHATLRIERAGANPRTVDVFNFHLGLSATERAHQVGMLIRSPEFAALEPHEPTLLGGDSNDWRSLLHPIFTEVLGFDCATQHRDRPLRTYPAFSPTGPLDRVYCRGRIRPLSARICRLGVSRLASDHRPVIADFELR